jgi:hypothetical protein
MQSQNCKIQEMHMQCTHMSNLGPN